MDNSEIAINVVSKVTGVSPKAILSPSRKFKVVECRMLVVLLLKRDGLSDESISWSLNRGRVTILHSRRVAEDTLDYSKTFREKFNKAHELYTEQKSLRVS